jgi:hypothetical protein
VWVGMCEKFIIGPYFFDANVTADAYLDMLNTFTIPELKKKRKFSTTIFQQDGAPPHWELNVRAFLNNSFNEKWIGRNGPIHWAARSPDLTPLDFYLWGKLKNEVYATPVNSLEHLKQKITDHLQLITQNELASVIENYKKRLSLCLEYKGKHFEQFLK